MRFSVEKSGVMPVSFYDLREAGWYFVAVLAGLYAAISLLEPQRVLWRKPGRKLLITFAAVWLIVLVSVTSSSLWSRHSRSYGRAPSSPSRRTPQLQIALGMLPISAWPVR
jgi:hypothetical protein